MIERRQRADIWIAYGVMAALGGGALLGMWFFWLK
jgi:hypothetical protein